MLRAHAALHQGVAGTILIEHYSLDNVFDFRVREGSTLLVDAVGGAGPTAILVALFVLTAIFGQLISNTATALVVIPIAVSAAEQLGVPLMALFFVVAVFVVPLVWRF